MQAAEKTLLLESVTGLESAKIAEVIQTKTAAIAEKLGFNAREIAQLENFGKIEGSINNVINTTPRAVQDISFSKHALQRSIERGVSREAILDALETPLKIEEIRIDHLGRSSQRFIGKKRKLLLTQTHSKLFL